jgi:hypothetical protein
MDFMMLLFVAVISIETVGNGYMCITDALHVARRNFPIGSRTREPTAQAVLTLWQGRTGVIQSL